MSASFSKIANILIFSDFLLYSGFGFLAPIFAVFVTEQIRGGSIEVVGFAAAIYLITKSLGQIPIGFFLDRVRGDKDDYYFALGGILLMGIVPMGYALSSLPWHIYALQAVYALGMAMFYPSWTALFGRHLKEDKQAFGWATDGSAIDLGAGVTGALGGIIASRFGFSAIFILADIFILVGALALIFIYNAIVRPHIEYRPAPKPKKMILS